MQTIFGAGGAIGKSLTKELLSYTTQIRLVGRNPEKINPGDELFKCDLTKADQVMKAVEGSEVVYLVAGIPYRLKIWKEQWPIIMRNTLDACIKHKAKLVFFDNIYMYDPKAIPHITEQSPINPSSGKGKVRAEIAQMLMNEVEKGKLQALIARSADFYGPGVTNGVLNEAVIKPLMAGKKANWFCSVDKQHSFTYTPDAAKATAILGNETNGWGKVWHLPTAPNPWTGKEYIDKIAELLHVESRTQVAGKGLVKIIGLFNPIMKEFVEMLYQYDQDYIFDSSHFEKTYGIKPTSYAYGLKESVEFALQNRK